MDHASLQHQSRQPSLLKKSYETRAGKSEFVYKYPEEHGPSPTTSHFL